MYLHKYRWSAIRQTLVLNAYLDMEKIAVHEVQTSLVTSNCLISKVQWYTGWSAIWQTLVLIFLTSHVTSNVRIHKEQLLIETSLYLIREVNLNLSKAFCFLKLWTFILILHSAKSMICIDTRQEATFDDNFRSTLG